MVARPWRLDDWLGIAGKDCCNCLCSLESRVACNRRPLTSQLPAYVYTVSHPNFSSTFELFVHPLSHAVTPLRRWSSFTVLHLAASVCKLFCTYRTVKFLMYADVIEDTKQRMQTRCELKFRDPHISSSHPLWEDMCCDVSPNDERWPSAHVDRTSRHLTRRLAYAVGRWDQYIATSLNSHACTQLHATATVTFLGIS